ncbi:MAG: hypothetical protein WCW01_01490 [Gammaproteobacteria bacterium]
MLEHTKQLLKSNFAKIRELTSSVECLSDIPTIFNQVRSSLSENEKIFLQASNTLNQDAELIVALSLLHNRNTIFSIQDANQIYKKIYSLKQLIILTNSAETIIKGLDMAIDLYHFCCIHVHDFTIQESSKSSHNTLFQLYQEQNQQDNTTFASQTPYPESEPFFFKPCSPINTVPVVESSCCCCRPFLKS